MQCDGLAVVSFAHPLINAAIAQIREAGVPVIALLSDIDEATNEPYVGQDNLEVGRTMGWLMAHTCGARKGSIGVLLGGHRFLGHQARVEGLRSYLMEHAPGLRLLEAVINLDNCDITEEATLELLARHDDLRGLCVVGGGGDGIINALSQLPKRPSLCCILQESTELSRQALSQGLISLVIDSQPRLLAAALVDLLVELQTAPDFDPARHRIHIPLQIVTSEERPRGELPLEVGSNGKHRHSSEPIHFVVQPATRNIQLFGGQADVAAGLLQGRNDRVHFMGAKVQCGPGFGHASRR